MQLVFRTTWSNLKVTGNHERINDIIIISLVNLASLLLLYRSSRYKNRRFVFVQRPFKDYFSSYETGQSVGGAKTSEPREKQSDTPASRTWLVSHVARAGLEPTPDTAVLSAVMKYWRS